LRWQLPGVSVSSDEKRATRRTERAPSINYGERMLAGGGVVSGRRTPAKPMWPEVTFFWVTSTGKDRLRRSTASAPISGALPGEQTARQR
jgi:hypothetical protein